MMRSSYIIILIITAASLRTTIHAQSPRALPSVYSSTPVNYVRNWEAVKPISNPNDLTLSIGPQVARVTTQYLDGLGRPLQTVVKEGSYPTGGTAVDLVSAVTYDELGRERFKYLPSPANNTGGNTHISDGQFKTNPFAQQQAFYNTYLSGQTGEVSSSQNWAYSQVNFEASPLNRPQEQFAPGVSWVGTEAQSTESNRHSVKTKYYTNTTTDSVRIWIVPINSAGSFSSYTSSSRYSPGELYKAVTIDEQNKQVIEFKDKEGRMVLRKVQVSGSGDNGSGAGHATDWLCTYYIYDDLNNLRCVIQPEGVRALAGNGWDLSGATLLAEQCFRYEYDERNRMIVKKVPGAGEVYMVYDARDRLVLTQDANMRAASPKQWLVTQYDELNRPIKTGIWNSNDTRSTHAGLAAGSINYPNWTTASIDLLTENFYDNYNWLAPNGNPFNTTMWTEASWVFATPSDINYPYPQEPLQSFQVKGLSTGKRVKVLGTSQYLYSIMYYDDKNRIIQVMEQNITGVTVRTSNQYSFDGKLITSIKLISNGNPGATQLQFVRSIIDYDNAGRVAQIQKTIHTANSVGNIFPVIARYEYDALGQLKNKKLSPYFNDGDGDSDDGLETLLFDYNIRGWTLGMNREFSKNDNQTQHYFGYELGYDQSAIKLADNTSIAGFQESQYNGNISGVIWKSTSDNVRRKYDYKYDPANRLLSADFIQFSNGSWNATDADFKVKMGDGLDVNTAYDANGNIRKMQQWGLTIAGSTKIDNLAYSYNTSSNKLLKVIDSISADYKLGDFKDGTSGSSNDYGYDDNGNLTSDLNKAISGITYNYLNLPLVISITGKGTITYTYDAAGNKLKKVTVDTTVSPSKTTTTLYLGDAVYQNDTLQFISHEEGRIRFKPDNASFQVDYMVKDHLGNVRMVLTEEQRSDQYPAATMEDATISAEEAHYSNLSATQNGRPGWFSDPLYPTNDKVSKLMNASGYSKIGPNILLKVMAGDKFSVRAASGWDSGSTPVNNSGSVLTDLLSNLAAGLPGLSGGKVTTGQIQGSSALSNALNTFLGTQTPPAASTAPKAFVNWILLDEQFKVVTEGCGFDVTGTVSAGTHIHARTNVSIPKSGYLYIYTSNESTNIQAFFDNLQVTHVRGPILEESHYYPFGLIMAGISSNALSFGGPQNKRKFNDGSELQSREFSDGGGLEWYSTSFRSFDPQLGRWCQLDPKPNHFHSLYSSMGNNPISNNDPLGDTLQVKGTTAAVDEFKSINDKALGGFYRTEVSADGDVTFVSTGKKGKMTRQQSRYYQEVSGILNQTERIKVDVVQNDESVLGDSFEKGVIDVSDISKLGFQHKSVTSGSFLAHALVEQNAKQKDGVTNYREAHAIGIEAERKITGYSRFQEGLYGQYNKQASFTGQAALSYTRILGPAPFMKRVMERKFVFITVDKNNFKKVEEF